MSAVLHHHPAEMQILALFHSICPDDAILPPFVHFGPARGRSVLLQRDRGNEVNEAWIATMFSQILELSEAL